MTMIDGKEMKLTGSKMSKRVALMVAASAVLVPAFAFAVETDRLTVEDPSTGAVMFRVTSGGNVTGNSFVGDGAGLTNVAHWKGVWSSATTYSKDDTVSFGGGSYIALKQSLAVQPDQDATSWAVFAQKGADGAAGAQGATGPQGPQGVKGDTGAQGPAGASPFALSGANAYYSGGNVGIGTASPAYTLDVNGQVRIAQSGTAGFAIKNNAASFGDVMSVGGAGNPTFLANWTIAGVQDDPAKPSWGMNMSVTQDQLLLQRAPAGVSAFTPLMAIKGTGNIGVGTTAPTQKFEVNGGVRLNTATAKPNCDATSRGTFWFAQGTTGNKDTVEVCAKDASDAYAWRPLY